MPLESFNTTMTQEKLITYLFMPIIGLWNGESLSRNLAELIDEVQITNIVREIAWQLLNALHQVHAKNFAHLDISLANFVLDKEGNLYLIDFGLATEIVDGKAKFGKANKLNEEYACPEFMWKAFFHKKEKFNSFDALIADSWAVGLILMDLILKGTKPILKHKYAVDNVSEFHDKFRGVQPNEVLKNWILDVKRFISDFLEEEWPKQIEDEQIKFPELRFIIEKLMIEPEQFTLKQIMELPFFDAYRIQQLQPIWSRAFIQEGVSSIFTDCEDNKPNLGYKTVSDMPIIEENRS